MKEFIEKLISRLKERENHYRCEVEKVKRFSKIRICRELQMRAYETSIKIVNELAEEYINCSTDTVVGTSSGWIPCTIAMPQKEQMYEVTMEIEICSRSEYVTDYALLDSNGKWLKGCRFKNGKVIAWKEKTEPYVPKKE